MKCKMNGNEVAMPCVASCPVFGDCVVEYQRTPKATKSTNADRIRAMSDEELADFLVELADDGNLKIRDWLTRPAEED